MRTARSVQFLYIHVREDGVRSGGTCVRIMCKFKYKIARDCNVICIQGLDLFKDIFNTNRVHKEKHVQSTRYMIFICVYVTASPACSGASAPRSAGPIQTATCKYIHCSRLYQRPIFIERGTFSIVAVVPHTFVPDPQGSSRPSPVSAEGRNDPSRPAMQCSDFVTDALCWFNLFREGSIFRFL